MEGDDSAYSVVCCGIRETSSLPQCSHLFSGKVLPRAFTAPTSLGDRLRDQNCRKSKSKSACVKIKIHCYLSSVEVK